MQAARHEAEEQLQEAEAAVLTHQASILHLQQQSHADALHLAQPHDSAEHRAHKLETQIKEFSPSMTEAGSRSQQQLQQESAAELLPNGTTLQVTNPLFCQHEGPVAQTPGLNPSLTNSAGPPQHIVDCQLDQAEYHTLAEPADSNPVPDLSLEQLQQQVQELHSELSTQASELQTAEAGKEYIQRLLNAVTAENKDLRSQLDRKQVLKRSASELKHSSPSQTLARAKAGLAEPLPEGLLGLRPVTSRIPAMWMTNSSVRRSLLPEYGLTGKPFVMGDMALQGAESLLNTSASEAEKDARREAESMPNEPSASGETASP